MKLKSILAAAAPLFLIAPGLPARAEPGADPPRFAANAQVFQDNHTHLLWTRCPIGMRWLPSMCVEHALYYMGDFAFDGSVKNNEYFGYDDARVYGCLMLVRSK